MRVAKAHAYGNDFLFTPRPDTAGADLSALARRMCARHTGIGADGLIVYDAAPSGRVGMQLLNADGSASELSGNGLRCLAALVVRQRRAAGLLVEPGARVEVDTDAGVKTLDLIEVEGGRFTFRAAMGTPTDVHEETIDVDGEALRVAVLGMGNPQCVQLVSTLPDDARFTRLGRGLATHPRFAQGTNVEFVTVVAPDHVRIRIWERGVGPTTASGTGACASAVVAIAFGGAVGDVRVESPGGVQRVEWRDEGVFLTGWAEVVVDGTWVAGPATVGD